MTDDFANARRRAIEYAIPQSNRVIGSQLIAMTAFANAYDESMSASGFPRQGGDGLRAALEPLARQADFYKEETPFFEMVKVPLELLRNARTALAAAPPAPQGEKIPCWMVTSPRWTLAEFLPTKEAADRYVDHFRTAVVTPGYFTPATIEDKSDVAV